MHKHAIPSRRIFESFVILALTLVTIPLPLRTASGAPGDLIDDFGFPSADGIATAGVGGGITAAGTFFGSVDFGGGTLTSLGIFTPDVFVASWDATGIHQWSFGRPHANGFGGVSVEAIASDATGNVYLAGQISDGDIDFGGGSLFGPNIFVVKLDAQGVHQWSNTYGAGNLKAIDVSSAGVAITGSTFGTVDFGGGPLDALLANVFVARFDPTGVHAWSRVIDGSFAGGSSVFSVKPYLAVDGDVAIAGEMRGSVDFGSGTPLSSSGQADIYVAKYDATTGAHQWSDLWGSTTSEIVNDLSRDSSGNLIVSGTMLGSFDAGGGALPFNAFSDLFVVALDTSGNHVWSAGFGTAGSDFFAGNAVDGAGNVLLFGGAGNNIDFGGGPLPDASLYLARFVPEPDLAEMTLIGALILSAFTNSARRRRTAQHGQGSGTKDIA